MDLAVSDDAQRRVVAEGDGEEGGRAQQCHVDRADLADVTYELETQRETRAIA